MIVIGADPGFSGALAAISRVDAQNDSLGLMCISKLFMPVIGEGRNRFIDHSAVAYWIDDVVGDSCVMACIERVHAMPGQGVTSMFKFGYAAGGIHAVFGVLGIPIRFVTPQEWRKKILFGYPKGKGASIAYVSQMYPTVNLLRTERCTKPSDGLADAICIAEYGVRHFISS